MTCTLSSAWHVLFTLHFRSDDDWSIQSKHHQMLSNFNLPTKSFLSKIIFKSFRGVSWNKILLNGTVEFPTSKCDPRVILQRQTRGYRPPAAKVGGVSSKHASVSHTKGCGNCIGVEKFDWSCLRLRNMDMLHHSRGYVTQGLRIPASHIWKHRGNLVQWIKMIKAYVQEIIFTTRKNWI